MNVVKQQLKNLSVPKAQALITSILVLLALILIGASKLWVSRISSVAQNETIAQTLLNKAKHYDARSKSEKSALQALMYADSAWVTAKAGRSAARLAGTMDESVQTLVKELGLAQQKRLGDVILRCPDLAVST
jgi:hypothetical protein